MDNTFNVILDSWITARERSIKTQQTFGMGGQRQFLDELKSHGTRMMAILPLMNLVQLEAFSELVSSMLSERRRQADAFRR